MKKKVLGLALVAMSVVSLTSMAQSKNTECNTTNKECVNKECKKMKGERRGKANPFEGMNLTEAQKTQLQQLKEKRSKLRAENKSADKAKKDADKQKKREARRAARKQYLQDVKSIIGADNYVVFLENIVLESPQGGKAVKQDRRNGKDKGGRHHHDKGHRADKTAQTAQL